MKNFFKTLGSFFLQGLLYVAPIAITIYVLIFIFNIVNNFSTSLTDAINVKIPGLGLLFMLILITFIGYFGRTFIAKSLFHFISTFITKIPVINTIYFAIKDVFSAFVGKEKKFNNPVLVRISENSEIFKIGFITQKDLSKLNLDTTMVSVYIPYSYAVMGSLVIIPAKNITELNISSSEALKFAISGGLTEIVDKQHTFKNEQ